MPKATPSLLVSGRGVGRWGNRGESEYVAVVLKRQALLVYQCSLWPGEVTSLMKSPGGGQQDFGAGSEQAAEAAEKRNLPC